jgi:hypothetical protein
MEVGYEGHFQIAGLDCRNFSLQSSGLSSAHNARSKIDKVSAIINNDSGRRAGTIRVGNRRAGPEQYHSGSGGMLVGRLVGRLLGCSDYRRQYRKTKYEDGAAAFHEALQQNLDVRESTL